MIESFEKTSWRNQYFSCALMDEGNIEQVEGQGKHRSWGPFSLLI